MFRLWIAVALAGCWTGNASTKAEAPPAQASTPAAAPTPPPRESTLQEQALQAMQAFGDRMCACTDIRCAEQVSNDMAAWSQALSRERPVNDFALSEEETKRAADLGMRLGECMQRAMTPPPQPGPAPTP